MHCPYGRPPVLAFPRQDEDRACYLAQRGLLLLQLQPKNYHGRNG